MKAAVILLVLALVSAVFAQTREDLAFVDDYAVATGPLIIVIPSNPSFDIEQTAFTNDATGIIGGQRDLAIVAEDGDSGKVLTSGVSNGEWTLSTPQDTSGYALMQYDGVDSEISLGNPSLNPGLGPFDVTFAGRGDSFRLLIETDIQTQYEFTLYDSQGRTSTATLVIPGDDAVHEFFIFFNDFDGNADFTQTAAIEVLIEAFNNVDTVIDAFTISGPIQPSSSLPPVPSSLPSPPPPGGFTWYTFDDDDNGRSPCADDVERRTYFLDDNAVVYYYFYGFDYVEASPSSASTLAVYTSAAVLLGVVAAFF